MRIGIRIRIKIKIGRVLGGDYDCEHEYDYEVGGDDKECWF